MKLNYSIGLTGKLKPLTGEKLLELINSKEIKKIQEDILNGSVEHQYAKANMLPTVYWEATYKNARHIAKDAIPTGLFGLDVDPKELAEGVTCDDIWDRCQQSGLIESGDIVAVHRSIRRVGIHIVCCCQEGLKTLYDNQKWLADKLGTKFDTNCKDWAHGFCLAPADDWYYIDNDLINELNN